MALFFLDTSILLGYARGATLASHIEEQYSISKPPNVAIASVVSKGELLSLAVQFGWGDDKKKKLEEILRQIPIADISDERVLRQYALIDSYSQGKDKSRPLPNGLSSRNMGKNDVWIAATASVLKATLLTTDKDFDHLHKVFLNVLWIDPSIGSNPS